jgi:hypothetical protein
MSRNITQRNYPPVRNIRNTRNMTLDTLNLTTCNASNITTNYNESNDTQVFNKLIIPFSATEPAVDESAIGELFLDTSTGNLMFFNGTSWETLYTD